MRRITCDKCGKVSNEIFACEYVSDINSKNGYDEYDLCKNCSNQWDELKDETFLKWLKEGRE